MYYHDERNHNRITALEWSVSKYRPGLKHIERIHPHHPVLQLDMNSRVQRPIALFQRPAIPFILIFMIFPIIWEKDPKNWTKTKKVTLILV